MISYKKSAKNAPIITICKNCNANINSSNSDSVITFYDWLQKKYGGFDGKRHASPETPQGFAIYARYTVDVMEDYIWEPHCNNISDWYEWLLPFFNDDKVLECFVQLWHEYREEIQFA